MKSAESRMRMSLILFPVALLLCMGDITHGSETQRLAYHLRHPQEQFCSADFGKWGNVFIRKMNKQKPTN